MPYIKREDRRPLDPLIEQVAALLPQREFAGAFNYVVSRLCAEILRNQPGYSRINELIGALECAKLELYRRVAGPYEDTKARAHGEVYAVGANEEDGPERP
jgi:hypothetical protein